MHYMPSGVIWGHSLGIDVFGEEEIRFCVQSFNAGKRRSIIFVLFPEKERVLIREPSGYLYISGQTHPSTAISLKGKQQTCMWMWREFCTACLCEKQPGFCFILLTEEKSQTGASAQTVFWSLCLPLTVVGAAPHSHSRQNAEACFCRVPDGEPLSCLAMNCPPTVK